MTENPPWMRELDPDVISMTAAMGEHGGSSVYVDTSPQHFEVVRGLVEELREAGFEVPARRVMWAGPMEVYLYVMGDITITAAAVKVAAEAVKSVADVINMFAKKNGKTVNIAGDEMTVVLDGRELTDEDRRRVDEFFAAHGEHLPPDDYGAGRLDF